MGEFSSRARHVDAEKIRLIDEYVAAHGSQPSNTTILKLRAQAALSTRPDKQVRPLAALTEEWRTRATTISTSALELTSSSTRCSPREVELRDGSRTTRRPGRSYGGAIDLPAAYVAEQVDLGYAVTAYRAPGVTTDTAHVLVEPTATRENFYVSMTRGCAANRAYVILDRADDPNASSWSILAGVLQHIGSELSAHEAITAEHDRWASLVCISSLTGE
ncbi:relaxase domain-containing protein [Flaviflexus sp. JY899]|uniref:Relaxase domain-containing protein n=1 Tax=Flaviflexus equikiangi TaxID=2758573 RepID=A0ABS2TCX6_9ACTO|nr:relaxase domain-containing protein [Flaviflexus equikiangi]